MLKSEKINRKPKENINIHNISTKSPANIEITWGQCPNIPTANGGLDLSTIPVKHFLSYYFHARILTIFLLALLYEVKQHYFAKT